jgi:hypothetical protein
VKVLYVLGFGRSGSTLLGLSIGELDGVFSGGELQSLWHESLLDGRLCGCGRPVADCDVWCEILGGPQCAHLGMSPEDVAALQAERLHLPILGPRFRVTGWSQAGWQAYADILGTLYRRIAEVTGARVVVDSSKLPSAERALRRLHDFDVYYLQLVRDPRAVAFSWMRTKQATDRTNRAEMERISPTRAAVTWMARQMAAERIRSRAAGRSLLLRYESFVADPRQSLQQVAELLGEPGANVDFISGTTARLTPNHTVSGNPLRLDGGSIELREDAEWKTRLPSRTRDVVTGICWPLLKRYGYA